MKARQNHLQASLQSILLLLVLLLPSRQSAAYEPNLSERPGTSVLSVGFGDQYAGVVGVMYRYRLPIPVEFGGSVGLFGTRVLTNNVGAIGTALLVRTYPFMSSNPLASGARRSFYLQLQYGNSLSNAFEWYEEDMASRPRLSIGWSGKYDYNISYSRRRDGRWGYRPLWGVSFGWYWDSENKVAPTPRQTLSNKTFDTCLKTGQLQACKRSGKFTAYAYQVTAEIREGSKPMQLHACQHLRSKNRSCGSKGAFQLQSAIRKLALYKTLRTAINASSASVAYPGAPDSRIAWRRALSATDCSSIRPLSSTYQAIDGCITRLVKLEAKWNRANLQDQQRAQQVKQIAVRMKRLARQAGEISKELEDSFVKQLQEWDCWTLDSSRDSLEKAKQCDSKFEILEAQRVKAHQKKTLDLIASIPALLQKAENVSYDVGNTAQRKINQEQCRDLSVNYSSSGQVDRCLQIIQAIEAEIAEEKRKKELARRKEAFQNQENFYRNCIRGNQAESIRACSVGNDPQCVEHALFLACGEKPVLVMPE